MEMAYGMVPWMEEIPGRDKQDKLGICLSKELLYKLEKKIIVGFCYDHIRK